MTSFIKNISSFFLWIRNYFDALAQLWPWTEKDIKRYECFLLKPQKNNKGV